MLKEENKMLKEQVQMLMELQKDVDERKWVFWNPLAKILTYLNCMSMRKHQGILYICVREHTCVLKIYNSGLGLVLTADQI